MVVKVTQRQCSNPLTYEFVAQPYLSRYAHTAFFTAHNLQHSGRELTKIGAVAEQVVGQILEFYEVRTIFVSGNRLTVVLKNSKSWETLPDQIVRIIEKAIDEYGVEQ